MTVLIKQSVSHQKLQSPDVVVAGVFQVDGWLRQHVGGHVADRFSHGLLWLESEDASRLVSFYTVAADIGSMLGMYCGLDTEFPERCRNDRPELLESVVAARDVEDASDR